MQKLSISFAPFSNIQKRDKGSVSVLLTVVAICRPIFSFSVGEIPEASRDLTLAGTKLTLNDFFAPGSLFV